jgi:hypothetical protein
MDIQIDTQNNKETEFQIDTQDSIEMALPFEIIEKIIEEIDDHPKEQFRVATIVRSKYMQFLSLPYIEEASMDSASRRNKKDLLNWWKNSGHSLVYTKDAVDFASANGHIKILDWWKNSGYNFLY